MKILAAFDKFKDSMTAATACEAAARGAREAYGSQVAVVQTPLTDGGEGFCNILTNAAKGHIETHVVCGPLGADLEAPLGWCEIETLPAAVQRSLNLNQGKIAIIEMAAAAGLEQVPAERRHPKHCTTYGVGELIRIAVAESADAILLGIGGSATSDLGLGVLQALGLQFINSEGHLIEQVLPRDWPRIQTIQGKLDVPTPPIFIACDVDNPLLGPRGAAAIYGPQKGLTANELDAFETQAAHMAEQLCQHFEQPNTCQEIPGSGAAGGIGFGLNLACDAHYLAGFDLVTDWLELNSKIAAADLILSGEGCIDRSSLDGKGPVALAGAAHTANKPSILLAGRVDPNAQEELCRIFPNCTVATITPAGYSLQQALMEGPINLQRTTADTLRQHAS